MLMLAFMIVALSGCKNSFNNGGCSPHTRWVKSICEVQGVRYECEVLICESDMQKLLGGEVPEGFKEVSK